VVEQTLVLMTSGAGRRSDKDDYNKNNGQQEFGRIRFGSFITLVLESHWRFPPKKHLVTLTDM
jgi:hypothetical protein